MKLYAVKPEWLYGDDKDAKREVQLELLKRLGIQESEAMGMAICNAEQAIELFGEGYCGSYTSPKEHIKLLYDVKSEVDIASMIEASVSSSMEAIGKLFNEKTSSEQPGPSLLNVDETLLMEDACTNALQENLDNGWRILAVCPQPQRRPDYVLGRKKGL
jgi:hypothetical protein